MNIELIAKGECAIEDILSLDNESLGLLLDHINYDRLGYTSNTDEFKIALFPINRNDGFTMFLPISPDVVKEYVIRQILKVKNSNYDLFE